MNPADTSSSHHLLSRIAGRGACVRRWSADKRGDARLQSWQRGLLAALELEEATHPSACATAFGSDLGSKGYRWFHLDLVHFAAGLNEVTLVPLRGAAAATPDDASALASAIRPHLAEYGLSLYELAQQWLVDSADEWDADTVTAQFARTHEWSESLPQGADAGKLRRLMTELQMLIHEDPVNQRRNARGVPTANAVWFWGNGRATQNNTSQPAACTGRNAYLRGICRMHGWAHTDDASAAALMSLCEQSSVVGVVDVASHQELESHWLSPLLEGLKQNRIASLRLILDEWDLTIDRWQLRAFWRSDRPLDTWARA